MLESQVHKTNTVNSKLQEHIDNMKKYQRRACIIVDGIKTRNDETEEDVKMKVVNHLQKEMNLKKEDFNKYYDKSHRLGPIKNGKQSIILRFMTHSFPHQIYNNRKQIQS